MGNIVSSAAKKAVTGMVGEQSKVRAAEQAVQERLSREGPLAQRRMRRGSMSLLSAERMGDAGMGLGSKLGGE